MQKDFSIMKWFIFPILALGCAIGTTYASVIMFDWSGSILYMILLAIIVFISLILVFQTGNKAVRAAMIAAFAFETIGIFALATTCIIAIYASRNYAGTKSAVADTNSQIEAISKLKSAKAQNTLVKNSSIKPPDMALATKEAENLMLYPLIAETANYFLGLIVVFGINLFMRGKTQGNVEPLPQYASGGIYTQSYNAPLRASSSHSVKDSKDNTLSLLASGNGVAIRLRKPGENTKHVLRVTRQVADQNNLESKTYEELARWTLAEMESANKQNEPRYKMLNDTL